MHPDRSPAWHDTVIREAWLGGYRLHEIAGATRLGPDAVMARVHALGLPERHPTTCVVLRPESLVPEPEPPPWLPAALDRVAAALG